MKSSGIGQKLVAAGLGMGLADFLFYGHHVGFTAALFSVFLIGVILATRPRVVLPGASRALALLLVGLVPALVLSPSVIGIGLMGIGVAALAVAVRSRFEEDVLAWAAQLVRVPLVMVQRVVRDLDLVRSGRFTSRYDRVITGEDLSGWALPLGMSAVFVGLFTLANPILSSGFSRLGHIVEQTLELFGNRISIPRTLFWIGSFAAIWALMRFRVSRRTVRDRDLVLANDVTETSVILRCLFMFNALFLVQNSMDLWVFLGGGGLPEGMTYAEYAHRGAYPLIATTWLAGLFVLVTFSSGQKAAEDHTARRLVSIWVGQNLFLLVSTLVRLVDYVEVYGLSRWRLATFVWIGIVAMGFLTLVHRILAARPNAWLLRANALSVLGVLYVLAFLDMDGFIARYNVRRTDDLASIDVTYLSDLGTAALPALDELGARCLDRVESDPDRVSQAFLQQMARIERLRGELSTRLEGRWSDWRGRSLRMALIRRAHRRTPRVDVAAVKAEWSRRRASRWAAARAVVEETSPAELERALTQRLTRAAGIGAGRS